MLSRRLCSGIISLFSLSQTAGEGKQPGVGEPTRSHPAYNNRSMNTIAVSLGDSCVDHYLAPIEKDFISGNALNVAVHMQQAGLPSAYVGSVGNDRCGEHILGALHEQSVDVFHVQPLLPVCTLAAGMGLK
jgi:hypothetical protein